MSEAKYIILGAGMSGFGAAHELVSNGIRATIFEARKRPGGVTSSYAYDDGFIFDEGVHISFASDERMKSIFAAAVKNDFHRARVYCNNYWKGYWFKHPAQVNLHGLPTEVVVACIKDFIEANTNHDTKIANYEDWLLAAFGKTFATTFPMEYTKKYHTTEASNLTTDWLGPRLYRPKIEEVLKGALEPEPLDVFYVEDFRYPMQGGFQAYIDGFSPFADVVCDHEVVRIDMKERNLAFKNGRSASFDKLVSSIPLDKLIPLIVGAPKDVLEAASLLACSQCAVVNIGINRPAGVRAQWSYFYDEDICFARVSYRDNFSPRVVPAGCGAFQAETYFSNKYKPMTGTAEDWIEPTIEGLLKCGLVHDPSEIIHKSAIWAPYANIIFDHDRPRSVEIVHGFLHDIGIARCGRYGDWGYIWTHQAFMSGERAAKGVQRVGVGCAAVTAP